MDTNEGQRREPTRLEAFNLIYLVLQLIGITVVILMASWVFGYLGGLSWSATPKIQFNWHPLLMTIGMIYLYGNSILLYRGFRFYRKRSLKLTHASIFGTIFFLMLIAGWAVYDSHVLNDPPIANFYSLHSWIGITAVVVFMCQWVAGFVTFLFPQLKAAKREAIMPYHIFFGMSGFVLAIAAALLGLSEKAGFRQLYTLTQESLIINMLGVLIVIYAILVIYLVSHRNYKRQPLPEDAILLTGHDETVTLLANQSDTDDENAS